MSQASEATVRTASVGEGGHRLPEMAPSALCQQNASSPFSPFPPSFPPFLFFFLFYFLLQIRISNPTPSPCWPRCVHTSRITGKWEGERRDSSLYKQPVAAG